MWFFHCLDPAASHGWQGTIPSVSFSLLPAIVYNGYYTTEQLNSLQTEKKCNKYVTEFCQQKTRSQVSEQQLNESQKIKILVKHKTTQLR